MSVSLDTFYKNQSLLYKGVLYVGTVVLIVFLFPRGGKFKYDFQKGRPWQYENLYAPFDFSIRKTAEELQQEREALEGNKQWYYTYDNAIALEAKSSFRNAFDNAFADNGQSAKRKGYLRQVGEEILEALYEIGIFETVDASGPLVVVKNNEAIPLRTKSQILTIAEAQQKTLADLSQAIADRTIAGQMEEVLKSVLQPNLFLDPDLTAKALDDEFSKLSFTRGEVPEGKLIITRGEVVEAEDFNILRSLRSEYESELWKGSNYYFILSGYTVLVALSLMMLFLFLKKYRQEIYVNNIKVTFIFFNIVLLVLVTTLVVKNFENYVYAVPLCILPLLLKNFFDARLGLFVHVLTVLILGFVVPNSFEYIFLQIIAGIVTILTVSELYKRANLFISVGQITLIYMVGYFAFNTIQEGNLDNIEWVVFGLFLLNGMITLFAQPLIYLYEKIFGLVSDVSLLELSDTNSGLLKELSDKAPGTFHHSLQVANLAEAAANEIGANAMLVRVGALYHDIGKMNNPTYFTENQVTNVNPHNDLPPKESAKIIIDHVLSGIELARKNKLPDRVIDFLRTHHGTSLVYYFFKKQRDIVPDAPEVDFRYPGPIPFSKETAILMMSDAVEAASKSLKSPTYSIIEEFVEKIVQGQLKAGQFLNADITLKEIETVKKVLKKKLTNIYHLRVEYPE
ncbi:MAG: HDIG domain-containing metalloprotein [Bacteroidota bacterium]